jgi:YggT family protein
MSQPDFVLGYLPFWIMNYALAAVIWTCIGRFFLAFVIALQPHNYIWRAFRLLTDWAVTAAAWITPSYVSPFWHPPIAAFWLFFLRLGLFFAMWHAGMTPSLNAPS